MKLVINGLSLDPAQKTDFLKTIIFKKYQLKVEDFIILRRSLDARKKDKIVYHYKILIEVATDYGPELLKNKEITEYLVPEEYSPKKIKKKLEVIIVGAGPAGLMAALRLVDSGAKVKIFERGEVLEERIKDVSLLREQGILNEESNILFGEGGAGTFSDGKLYSRIKVPEVNWFYQKLVDLGASSSILYEAKPHLGTDRLRVIVKNLRKELQKKGVEFYFNEKVTDFLEKEGQIRGIRTARGREIISSSVILATGHSARDIYQLLADKNIVLDKKSFAVGLRVEHPASLIRDSQYGRSAYKDTLPPAEYVLTYKNKKTGRGVYSFCMCPGGEIVNASSKQGMLNLNGMSFSRRDGFFSNSAIMVTISKDDLEEDVLAGIRFQEKLEKAAFQAGGGEFLAPIQSIPSFYEKKLDKRTSGTSKGVNSFWETGSSYKPGTRPADFNIFLPNWLILELKEALVNFNQKIKGFSGEQGFLIGIETRSSSPVRISRGDDFQSLNLKGLFPVGEGAGYSGGIVSSALDGLRVADYMVS